MNIRESVIHIRQQLPGGTRLVAVSKFHPPADILEAYKAGQRIFGESKAQELREKYEMLPKDIEWHFIGHLQTNKIKYIIPFVSMIHSIDSLKLLAEVNKCAAKAGRKVPVLLQVHIAQEETKYGFDGEELKELLNSGSFREYKNTTLAGLMGMATFTDNTGQVREEFEQLACLYRELKGGFFASNDEFRELSIGMSDDYPFAVQAGSTLVRIGSRIFGSRI